MRYKVLKNIEHDGTAYGEGDEIELSPQIAELHGQNLELATDKPKVDAKGKP